MLTIKGIDSRVTPFRAHICYSLPLVNTGVISLRGTQPVSTIIPSTRIDMLIQRCGSHVTTLEIHRCHSLPSFGGGVKCRNIVEVMCPVVSANNIEYSVQFYQPMVSSWCRVFMKRMRVPTIGSGVIRLKETYWTPAAPPT